MGKGCPPSCPRVHLSEVPVQHFLGLRLGLGLGLGLGQDLSEHLWGSELFAVWMTLDDPNPTLTLGQVDPQTTVYEPIGPSCFSLV